MTRDKMRSTLYFFLSAKDPQSIGEKLYLVFSNYPSSMIDAWGRPMAFEIETSNTIRIVSLGEDGKLGTRDDLVESVVVGDGVKSAVPGERN